MLNWTLVLASVMAVVVADNLPSDYKTSYKYYNMQVNRLGIEYVSQRFPCFDPNGRCLTVHNDQAEYEKYEVNVIGDAHAQCNQKYRTGHGDLEHTVYSGRCFTTTPTVYLITCRSPPNDPDFTQGWITVHNEVDQTYFWAQNGAKARFQHADHNSVQENPFLTHDVQKQPNPDVEVFCPT